MFGLKQLVTGHQDQNLFNQLAFKAETALAVTLAIAVIQTLIYGSDGHRLALIAGSLLSIVILAGLCKGARKILSGVLSYIPYLFGIYLFFFEGFIRLNRLMGRFTVEDTALVIVFFPTGKYCRHSRL